MRAAVIHTPQLAPGPIDVAAIIATQSASPGRHRSSCYDCGKRRMLEFSLLIGVSEGLWLCDEDWHQRLVELRQSFRVDN